MRPIVVHSLILVLAVAVAGCRRSEEAPPPPDAAMPPVQAQPPAGAAVGSSSIARVSSVQLGSAIDPSKRVVEPKSAFAPSDTIYVSIDTSASDPITLTARWTYEDGQVVNESSKTTAAGASTTEFQIAKPSGWPSGSYQVEILADGSTAAVQRFEVR